MKLIYKENPGEWRKSVLLPSLALAIISSLLRWRKHLPVNYWYALLAVLALVAICAVLQPRWFRGWYRLSLRLGFYSSQFIGRCVLLVFFIFVITPVGWILRLIGKDTLQLKRQPNATTYWHTAKECNPLDRMF
jgi:multisubunit Na+/H+ antiporter MnhG subunit